MNLVAEDGTELDAENGSPINPEAYLMLVVEDGTGTDPDADSYCSVATADQYHAGFGNSDWADLDTATKEIYLRKATRDMDLLYAYIGHELSPSTQSLAWPRTAAAGLPRALVYACAEMALLCETIDVTGTPDGLQNVQLSAVEFGDVKIKTQYFTQNAITAPELRKVNLLLQKLIDPLRASDLFVQVVRG